MATANDDAWTDEAIDRALRDVVAAADLGTDWAALRASILRSRLGELGAVTLTGAFVVIAAIDTWLSALGRPTESGPAPGVYQFLLVLLSLALLAIVALRRIREVRNATSPAYLDYFYRRDLSGRIRTARNGLLWAVLFTLYAFDISWNHTVSGPVRALGVAFAVCIAAFSLWDRVVNFPRLEREQQDLPDFTEIPRIG